MKTDIPPSSDISLDRVTSDDSSTMSRRPTLTTSMEKEVSPNSSILMRQKQVRSARARRIKGQKGVVMVSSSADEVTHDKPRPSSAAPTFCDHHKPSEVDTSCKLSALSLLIDRCMQVAIQEARDDPEKRRTVEQKDLVNRYLSRALADDDDAARRGSTSPLISSYIKMSIARMCGLSPVAAVAPASQEELFIVMDKTMLEGTEKPEVHGARRLSATSEASVFAVKACLENAVDQLQRDFMRVRVTAETVASEMDTLAQWAAGGVPQSSTSEIVRGCLQMALDDFRCAVSRREFTRETSVTSQLVRGYLERALKAVHSVSAQCKASETSLLHVSVDAPVTSRRSPKMEGLLKEYIRRALSERYDEVWRSVVESEAAAGIVQHSMRLALDRMEHEASPSPSPSGTSALINHYIREAVASVLAVDPNDPAIRAGVSQQLVRSTSVDLVNACLERARHCVNADRCLVLPRPSGSTFGDIDSEAVASLVDGYMQLAVTEHDTVKPQESRPLHSVRRPHTAPASPENSYYRGLSQSDAFSCSGYTPSSTSTEASDGGKKRNRSRRRHVHPAGQTMFTTKWLVQPAPPRTRNRKPGWKSSASGENVTGTAEGQRERPKSARPRKKKSARAFHDDATPMNTTEMYVEAKNRVRRRPLRPKLIVFGSAIDTTTTSTPPEPVVTQTGVASGTQTDSDGADYVRAAVQIAVTPATPRNSCSDTSRQCANIKTFKSYLHVTNSAETHAVLSKGSSNSLGMPSAGSFDVQLRATSVGSAQAVNALPAHARFRTFHRPASVKRKLRDI
ncbi:hypothetical protein NP493_486g02007 [Ridgeia piscesae]|uniref:Uncharacterized protein n=1 Tax=Ridgeia piscesae TaxID=27915 RepID=A0AAD9KY83_RIDPI|nr:hypothetical protein NP493_486g02007 [Ridgeia piscesae]